MSLEIREIIQEIAKEVLERGFGIPCTVLSYDEDSKTIDCEPIDGSADFLTVKLQAEVSSGVLIVPKVGSFIILEQTSNDSAYVSLFGEVDEIILMDGENGGLVKVSELVDKMNNIENKLNTLLSTFNTHVHTGVTTGAGSSGTTPSIVSGSLTPTQIQDLENDKISH